MKVIEIGLKKVVENICCSTSDANYWSFVDLFRNDTLSYYAITIFTDWGLPPTSVAILYQVCLNQTFIFPHRLH